MATIRKVSTVIGSELKAGQIVICNQTVEPILFTAQLIIFGSLVHDNKTSTA